MLRNMISKLGKPGKKMEGQDTAQIVSDFTKCADCVGDLIKLSVAYQERFGAEVKNWPMLTLCNFMDDFARIVERMEKQ